MKRFLSAALLLLVFASPAFARTKRPPKPLHKNTPHPYTKHQATKHPNPHPQTKHETTKHPIPVHPKRKS